MFIPNIMTVDESIFLRRNFWNIIYWILYVSFFKNVSSISKQIPDVPLRLKEKPKSKSRFSRDSTSFVQRHNSGGSSSFVQRHNSGGTVQRHNSAGSSIPPSRESSGSSAGSKIYFKMFLKIYKKILIHSFLCF